VKPDVLQKIRDMAEAILTTEEIKNKDDSPQIVKEIQPGDWQQGKTTLKNITKCGIGL
jgi:hypothetical protein